MRRRDLLVTAALATTLLSAGTAEARSRAAIRLTAAFDNGARLGRATALHIGLHIDTRRRSSPVTAIEMRYPESIGVTTSGLGLEACRRPLSDFQAVVVDAIGLAGCPRNAVMAKGTASGEIRLNGALEDAIHEVGTVTVLAGPIRDGRLGIVTYVDGWNPIGARLVYAGEIAPAPRPYGGSLEIRIPPLPSAWQAEIALTDVSFAIGARSIVYHERVRGRTVAYRPEGIALPTRCPSGGFKFVTGAHLRERSQNERDRCRRLS
jgi:hypothetical protein